MSYSVDQTSSGIVRLRDYLNYGTGRNPLAVAQIGLKLGMEKCVPRVPV